ncbi:Ion channel [Cooperia oncophora]
MGYLEPHEDSMISLPIKFCLMLLAGYLLFTAAFVYFFDEWMGYVPESGLSFFTALYFSYISISTIGLGDIMPKNATFHPIISALFFFGMPVMKVVNRATYVFIENGVFGAFTLLENSIDRLTSKIQPKEEEVNSLRLGTLTKIRFSDQGSCENRNFQPSIRSSKKISRCSYCTHINEEVEEDQATELLNGLTIRSLAAFARANSDVYGGGFGRVNLRAGDLVQSRTNVSQNPGGTSP